MRINKAKASEIIYEASKAQESTLDTIWVKKIEHLSYLCGQGSSKTHIAFLGTSILAKSVDIRADLFAIKPKHSPNNPNAFSARTLCHSVLVPASAEIGFSLGVTGREPLNNQPYFRMKRLDDGTPVHPNSREAYEYMLSLVRELNSLQNETQANKVLQAYIAVRKRYQFSYQTSSEIIDISPEKLTRTITIFVNENSENGRRAQAVVAGLMDIFAGPDRVESGRINDPSRNYPGDVCVNSNDANTNWEKAIEVRDKPVSLSDIRIFGKKCIDMGVQEAAFVMVSENQEIFDIKILIEWADKFHLGLTLFYGWDTFIDQCLYWCELPKPVAASRAIDSIRERLIQVEVDVNSLQTWDMLISEPIL